MKTYFFIFIAVIFSFHLLNAQNLLTNPGFEQGMQGWDDLWTRTPNAGTAEIVDSPVHDGNYALHVQHWDTQDWSLRQSAQIAVQTGQIYRCSAWVNAVEIDDWAELSVILYDQSGAVMDWSFAPNYIDVSDGYEYYTMQFIIPSQVYALTVRFVGGGDTDIYFDDIVFEQTGVVNPDEEHILENAALRVSLATPSLAMQVTLKNSGEIFDFQGVNNADFYEITQNNNQLILKGIFLQQDFDFTLSCELDENTLAFQLAADPEAELSEGFSFPGYAKSRQDDYLIIPRATGMILPVKEEYPFWQFGLYDWKATMAFAGVTNLQNGYMIYTQDPWDSRFQFFKPTEADHSTLQFVNEASKSVFGYDRHFYLSFFESGGYVRMAEIYREFVAEMGYLKTFAEKQADNADITKLQGAVDFWALQQRFRTTKFVDSLYYFGIDKAIVSLGGGWYNNNELQEIILHLNDRGLLSSRYDIFTDVWPDELPAMPWYRTEGYPQDVIVNEDGSLRTGWLAYLEDGTPYQGYYTCSATHADYARNRIAEDLDINPYNCRFIDVELSSSLTECFSTVHPVTRKQDGEYRTQALNVVKNEFNLITGSEEAREFAFPVVDFGEGTMSIIPSTGAGYDWSTPVDEPGDDFINYNMNPARRIPLHGLVYHDVHVPTWYTGDGLSKVPAFWTDKELLNILYASMPLVMPPSTAYWSEHREHFLTSMNLISAVTRNCGFAKMTNHQFLSGDKKVQQTEFDNGWTVVVNFSDSDHLYNNTILSAKGFYAADDEHEVYRIQQNGSELAVADLQDRLFIQPNSQPVEVSGVRTNGAVLLLKDDESLRLALIGGQSSVDIDPAYIPWPLENITVTGLSGQTAIATQPQSDGFIRIAKTGNEIFYKIQGDFLTRVDAQQSHFEFSLEQNYPNPFNPTTTLVYSLDCQVQVTLNVYNALGQCIKTLVDEKQPAGEYHVMWDGCDDKGAQVSSGVYWIQMQSGERQQNRKVMLMR